MGLASHDEAMDALRAENEELEAAVDALTEAFVLQRERIAHLRSAFKMGMPSHIILKGDLERGLDVDRALDALAEHLRP